MRVFRHLPPLSHPPCALTIGNFDGMHLGHQALLKALTSRAQTMQVDSAVLIFEPQPREFFSPQQTPVRLSNLREKLEQFAAYDIARVYVCAFNRRFANISAANFLTDIVQGALQAQVVLVGEDFRFGAGRQGTVADFAHVGLLVKQPQVNIDEHRVSSTRVRAALLLGDLGTATTLLGRPYSMSGRVVRGAGLGRELGYATANIQIHHLRTALQGVFVVRLNGMPAVANLGMRPTLGGAGKLMLEVHVLNFTHTLYGEHVRVEFLAKLRDECHFENLTALRLAIASDVVAAQHFFDNQPVSSPA
ncbi:MAG: bifunctional riboflavin kinase/FAD synthetase [Methylophilaceae bacterium]|nr:bifunctional riboflavin kinase/FAD synthetase [Methylophilaceae bacterium]